MARCFSIVALLSSCLMFYPASASESVLHLQDARKNRSYISISMYELGLLPQVTYETMTQWTKGETVFRGPSLRSVLDEAGASELPPEAVLLLTAANGYSVRFPHRYVEDEAPIIAIEKDGKPMSLRDNGPLWLVFPFDDDPKYQSELFYSFSIWQLTKITVFYEN